MKTNQILGSRLQNRIAQHGQDEPEFFKYIVIEWEGHEQVVSLPFKTKHADVLEYIREQTPDVQAVAAGFFFDHAGAFWAGGESDSLNLKSRPQDKELIQTFLSSADRRQWDLNIMAQDATQL